MKSLKLFTTLITLSFLFFSCDENNMEKQDELDLSNLNLDGIKISLEPVRLSLKEYPLEEIFKQIGKDMFDEDSEIPSTNGRTSEVGFVGVDLTILDTGEDVIITPIEGTTSEDGDDEKCGGEEGDGWTSYGLCWSESCVEEKLKEAADDLGEPASGQCLDLRVRRTSTNARVCGRMTSC